MDVPHVDLAFISVEHKQIFEICLISCTMDIKKNNYNEVDKEVPIITYNNAETDRLQILKENKGKLEFTNGLI